VGGCSELRPKGALASAQKHLKKTQKHLKKTQKHLKKTQKHFKNKKANLCFGNYLKKRQ
jgi:hypothetical protein